MTGVVPLGAGGTPFERLQVQFSEPLDSSTLTLDQVLVSGPSGPITPLQLIQDASDRYTIDLTGLTSRATYTLDIGPDLRAANGDLLDQDHDGPDVDPTGDTYHGTLAASGLTIGDQDLSLDGRYLVLDSGTTTIDGLHSFGGLALFHQAVVTDSAIGSPAPSQLVLTITDSLTIDATSSIDVSGKGYAGGYTAGNTTSGGATGWSAGSYGGYGWANGGATNAAYGDYRNPAEPGSGGWNAHHGSGGPGGPGAGGGLVRITAATASVDGAIRADGNAGWSWDGWGGGGSGGGIMLAVGALTGGGVVEANGGGVSGGPGGGGGGGRVAIVYDTASFDVTGRVTALGGSGGAGAGGVGTVYLKDNAGGSVLRVDSHGAPAGAWTPLGVAVDGGLSYDRLVVSGAGVVAIPEHQMAVAANDVEILQGAVLTTRATDAAQEYSLVLTVAGTLTVDATSSIDVSGKGYAGQYTAGDTTSGGATGWSAGSYGGYGYGGATNAAYGDYRDPDELGSGGSNANHGSAGPGGPGAGGGLVRIAAATASVDGAIRADGSAGWSWDGWGGGGSGGGILLSVGALTGSGVIEANGGGVSGGPGGGGGGGRVAILYDRSTFDVLGKVTAHSGTNGSAGGVGTVYLEEEGIGGVLRVDSHGTPVGAWTPLGVPGELGFVVDHLVVSGAGVVAAPEHQMAVTANDVDLLGGAVLTTRATTTQEYSLLLSIAGTLTIDASSSIDVSGKGYAGQYTAGNTTSGGASGWSAGSYGGVGFAAPATAVYGDPRNPNELGSGGSNAHHGSAGPGGPGAGGGLVRITAAAAAVDGAIRADGSGGWSWDGWGGGGSGGGILLSVGTLTGSGVIEANGGGVSGGPGGGGGGGRISVYSWSSMAMNVASLHADGGTGGSGPGGVGSIVVSSTPFLSWSDNRAFYHDIQAIGWSLLGLDPRTVKVELTAYGADATLSLAASLPATGSFPWDTRTASDGPYEVRAVFRDSAGKVLGELTRQVLVDNALDWHSGRIAADETWTVDRVHAVDGALTVAAGVTLTITPGALVKFSPRSGSRIVLEAGATLNAPATADSPIVFTSLSDDSAGGDSNLDGSQTMPRPGDWNGFAVAPGATLNLGPAVDLRYMQQTHAGTITGAETWLGTFTHEITDSIVVPDGATLTIQPGAVVKFDPGKGIEVRPGGRVLADGSVALPIVFTSIRDDSVGGDTNQDGDSTTASAGDWKGILVDGGQAVLDHVRVLDSGWTSSGQWETTAGALSISNGGTVTISNGVIRDSFYDALIAWGSGSITAISTLMTGCDRGLDPDGSTLTKLINCTIDGTRIGIWGHNGSVQVTNTIISNSIEHGIYNILNSPITLSGSDIWSATGTNYAGNIGDQTGVNGNISADPKYRDVTQGDYRLGYRSPAIDAGDGTAAPATDAMDVGRYNDPRTSPRTGTPDAQGRYADMGAFEFVELAPSDVDLTAGAVVGPVAVTSGRIVHVTWTETNLGTGAANGPWHDSINLVLDPTGVATAISAGEVLVGQGIILGPGQSLTASADVLVPGAIPGDYAWQVIVNSRGEVFEGQNRANNAIDAAAWTAVDLPTLTIGADALTGQFDRAGQSFAFQVVPVSGEDLLLTLDASPSHGAVELFVARGTMPGTSTFDLRSLEFNSPTSTVTLTNPRGEPYYIVAYARSLDAAQVGFSIRARSTDFRVDSASPGAVGAGPVTLQVRGEHLLDGDTYQLVGPGGATRVSSSVTVPDPTSSYPTFDLTGAPAGGYTLNVLRSGTVIATLTGAVTVVAANTELETQIIGPSRIRVGRSFTAYVSYRNVGNTDIPSPMLILSTRGVAGMRLRDEDTFDTDDLLLIGVSFEGPAGILRPGQEWRIPFSALASSTAHFDITIASKPAGATDSIDWTSIEAKVRPSGVADDVWAAAWRAFRAAAGNTWGGYIRLLDTYATKLGAELGTLSYSAPTVIRAAVRDFIDQVDSSARGTLYLDDPGHPLGGVQISAVREDGSVTVTGMSANDGSFFIPRADAGTYTLSVPGYLLTSPTTLTVVGTAMTTGLEVVVARGATLSGSVRKQSDGSSVGGVEVIVVDAQSRSHCTVTGDDGTYAIAGLPAGTYAMTASAEGLAPSTIAAVTASAGGTVVGLNFRLGPGAELKGTVARAGDASPFAGAKVTLTDARGTPLSTSTDSSGAFDLTSLAPGVYDVSVDATGYATVWETGISLVAGTTSLPTITLGNEAALTITFTDSVSQQRLSGAMFLILAGQDGPVLASAASDASGQASLARLAPGSYVLELEAEGYLARSVSFVLAPGQSEVLSYALEPAGVIRGQVLDASGTGVGGVTVVILGSGGYNQQVISAADGSYRVGALLPGDYAVSVGGDPGILRQDVAVGPATSGQPVDFTLAGATIDGRVTASDGSTAAPGALIVLLSQGLPVSTAICDGQGHYLFKAVAAGTYTLAGACDSGYTATAEVNVSGAANVTVPVLGLGNLELGGTASDLAGQALAGASVYVFPEDEPFFTQVAPRVTDAQGRFTAQGLIPGTYSVRIVQPGFAIYRDSVTLPLGNLPASLEARLEQGATLSGRITIAADGSPASAATVLLYDARSGEILGRTTTSADGSYSFPNLDQGEYDLLASQAGLREAYLAGVMPGAASPAHDLVLAAVDTVLEGRVVDPDGHAVTDANVVVANPCGEIMAVMSTGFDGTFRTDQLPPGSYQIRASAGGSFPSLAPATTLIDGQTVSGLQLVLAPAGIDPDGPSLPGYYQSMVDAVVSGSNQFANWSMSKLSPDIWQKYNPTPTLEPGDAMYMVPPGAACPEAFHAFYLAVQASSRKDRAFDHWKAMSANFDATMGNSANIFMWQLADTIASFYSPRVSGAVTSTINGLNGTIAGLDELMLGQIQSSMINDFALVKSLNDAQKVVTNGCKFVTGLVSNLSQVGVPRTADDFRSVMGAVGSFISQTTAIIGGIDGVRNAIALFNTGQVVSSPAVSFMNKWIAPLGKLLTTLVGMYDSYKAINNLQNSVPDAAADYRRRVSEYQQAVQAVEAANRNCYHCPDRPAPGQKCPDPPPQPQDPGKPQPYNPDQASDPNDKLTTGYGTQGFITGTGPLDYTIDFENQPTATVPAQEVVITDQLDPNLDWSTFQLRTIGFNNVTIHVPAGVQTYSTQVSVPTDPNPVKVTVSLDPATGVVTWSMMSVDATTGQLVQDPIAGFLPPDDANHAGEGFVTYSVSPRSGLASGTVIDNIARIVFDVNAPIDTNHAINTIDRDAPTSSISALPALTRATSFDVSWTGSDGNGSGISGYRVYASEDGGPFTLWQSNTTATQATFVGQLNHTYAFYSVATDGAGNAESIPGSAQAQTTLQYASDPGVDHVTVAMTAGPPTSSRFQVVFTLPMNLAGMIANGSITGAVMLTGHAQGQISLSASEFGYNATTRTLTLIVPGLPEGAYDLTLDGSKLLDASGSPLRGGTGDTITYTLPSFDAATVLQAGGSDIRANAYSVPAMGDWNGDGLTDLIVGEETADGLGKVRVYLNQGTNPSPVYSSFTYARMSDGSDLSVPAAGCLGAFPRLIDWDGDSKPDLLVGRADGGIDFFANAGTASSPAFGTPGLISAGNPGALAAINVGARATFDVVDWNDDGRKDLVVGALDGKVRVYLNLAATGSPDLAAAIIVQAAGTDLIAPSGRSSVAVADLDGDGRKDLIVGDTDGTLLLYRNIGTDPAPTFGPYQPIAAGGSAINLGVGTRSRPFVGDFNHDGTPDLLVGASDGLVRLYVGHPGTAGPTTGQPGDPYIDTTTLVLPPTAHLASPSAGSSILDQSLDARGYLDVTFQASSGQVIDSSTLADPSPEFTLSGPGVGTAAVNGSGSPVSGNTYRYHVSGGFAAGEVVVHFVAGSFADTQRHGNEASSESFTVTVQPIVPPTPHLADPSAGATLIDWSLDVRGYLDMTFQADAGQNIDPATILDGGAEFVLGGPGAGSVAVDGSGSLVSGTTYRYGFTGSFAAGEVVVSFAAGSFADARGIGNLASSESFTVNVQPSVWIDPAPAAREGKGKNAVLIFPVHLSAPISEPVTVAYTTSGGTAVAGKNYKPTHGTLTFKPGGATVQTIKVPLLGNKKYGDDVTVQVSLSPAGGSTPIARGTATGTILESDRMPRLSIKNASVRESNSGARAMTFVVTLSSPSTRTTTVVYTTADGTATVAGRDYQATQGVLTFPPGATRRTFTVLVYGDTVYEPKETFRVLLSSPDGASIAHGSATGSIINDDKRAAKPRRASVSIHPVATRSVPSVRATAATSTGLASLSSIGRAGPSAVARAMTPVIRVIRDGNVGRSLALDARPGLTTRVRSRQRLVDEAIRSIIEGGI